MKFLIVGYGFVGKAVHNVFREHHDCTIIDPLHGDKKIEDHHDADGIIVCVPTPTTEDGINDASIVANVLDQVPLFIPVLVKSTVTPATAKAFDEIYKNHSIVYSPEFLRARTANNDFKNQKYVILGGEDPDAFWHEIFLKTLPDCKIVFNCTAEEACMVKYATNSFLAIKTSFFNQIFDLCVNNGMDFDVVRQLLSQDTRIGPGHTVVPGPDGLRGWGGACFPKDTEAFVQWSTSAGYPATLVKSAIEYNKKVRKTS
jgi:UDPglucose 6-dehydrogenase